MQKQSKKQQSTVMKGLVASACCVIAAAAVMVGLSLGSPAAVETAAVGAASGLSAQESLTATDQSAAQYPLAENPSAEALEKFSSVLTVVDGAGQSVALQDVPSGSYSGFLVEIAEGQTQQATVAKMAAAEEEGLVKRVYGTTYSVVSLDTLAGIVEAGELAMAEPNYTLHLVGQVDDEAVEALAFSTQGGTDANPAPNYPPSDPYYLSGKLWNLDMLKVQGAWELGLDGDVYVHNQTPVRDTPVRVAVIDTGLYGTGEGEAQHEDLNYDHVVDGYNFATSDEGTPDVQGHGTFVSGLIAAQVNNSVGVAGAMPGAYIVPCKVFDKSSASTEDVISAIYYAADEGKADVINMSLGGEYNSSAMEKACEYAVSKGVLVVASAGNDGVSTPNYPAAYDCVVGVASVDSAQQRSSWSQYGKSVFVTGPGESVTSTYYGGSSEYRTASGTSFSGPEVAALAAMCKSVYPDMTQEIFKEFLIETSTDLGERGYDDYYGYGLVNFEAMAQVVLASQTLPWYNLTFAVTNAQGAAVENPVVELRAAEDISWGDDSEHGIEAGSLEAGQLVAPQADGTYKVHRGVYDYAVSAQGYYLATGTVKTYAENQEVAVSLEDAYNVTIAVQNQEGVALDRARVAVVSSTGRSETSQANEAGQPVFTLMSGVYSYEITAENDYQKARGSFVVQRQDKNFSFTLLTADQSSTVSFEAVDAQTGETLSNATVVVYDQQECQIYPSDEGGYLLARGGTYKAIASRLGYEDALETFTVEDAEEQLVSLEMTPAECAITFRALTADGKTVAGATVTVLDEQGTAKSSSAFDPLRFYLKAGTYTYQMQAPGYQTVQSQFSVSVESRTLTVVMEGVPQTVTFKVTNAATGQVLEGASFKVVSATSAAAIKANADGSYTLAPGDYRYSAYCSGYQSARGSFQVEGEALTIPVALTSYEGSTEGYAGGTGTADDPYLIATEAQLRHLAAQTDIVRAGKTDAATNQKATLTGYYQLVCDIELTDAWLPIGNYENGSNYYAFAGTFDGAGHRISGLRTVESDYSAQGLFGCIQNATIMNLTVEGSVVGDSYVGGLVGMVRYFYDSSYSDWNTGSSRIENCFNYATVTGRYATGGIVGSTSGSITTSDEYGTVIARCGNHGAVSSRDQGEFTRRASTAGGIAGSSANAKVEYCYNQGTVQAGYCAAGLVAQSLGGLGLFNSYNAGEVYSYVSGSGYAGTSGGLAGRLVKSTLAGCYAVIPVDDSAEQGPIGATDTATQVSNYRMLERADMWRNADFVALMNTDVLTDTAYTYFVMGTGYPLLRSEVAADQVLAEAPYVIEHPASTDVAYKLGDEATPLRAQVESVSDGGSLTWAWYEVDQQGVAVALEGATGEGLVATYTPSTEALGTRSYFARFTNTVTVQDAVGATSADSQVAAVQVRSTVDAEAPVITAFNPSAAQQFNTDLKVKVTTDLLLSVEASVGDGGTLSYQWYRSSSMVGEGVAIAGATEAAYTADTSSLGTTYYYVKVSNTTEPGNVTSVKSDWAQATVGEYTISSLEELMSFRTAVNTGETFEGLVVYLKADLDVSAQAWEPIGTDDHPFMGTFMGGAGYAGSTQIETHTISGLRIDGDALGNEDLGFFGVVRGATICDVLVGGSVNGAANRYAGLLVGSALAGSSVENCGTLAGSQVEGKYCIGGLVGYGNTAVKDCVNRADVTARAYVPTSDDKNLDNTGYITKAAAGVIAYAGSGYVQGCYNAGTISADAIDVSAGQKCVYYVGGVVGYGSTSAAVLSCFDVGTVSVGTWAEKSISFRPAGVCYAAAVAGYQAYDYLYNIHYLDGVAACGTNSTNPNLDYGENHTLAFMKTAYFVGLLHDGYSYGAQFVQSVNGVPHLVWETDTTSGDNMTDAAEPYLYDLTLEDIDDLTSTWSVYYYQGEQAPVLYLWVDQPQPEKGTLTYQWQQRTVGGSEEDWTDIAGAAGVCEASGDHFRAPYVISTAEVGACQVRCVVTNTLTGATGRASLDNETPALTIEIREDAGLFQLRDASKANAQDNPWVISAAQQLHFLAQLVNGETKMVGVKDTSFKGQYFELASDLDLSGYENWEPIGTGDSTNGSPFKGIFDGAGHAITGLCIVVSEGDSCDYLGLFGSISGGTLRNLCVSGSVNAGASGWMTGGICAYAYGSYLENLANHVNVTGSIRVGGVCGTIGSCRVEDCVNTGTISLANSDNNVQYDLGGVCGYSFNSAAPEGAGLYNCVNTGLVTGVLAYGTDPRFGAVLGTDSTNNTPRSNCFYLDGSALCLTDGTKATGVGSSKKYVDDREGSVEVFGADEALEVAWRLNAGAEGAHSGRWGASAAVSDTPALPALTLCGVGAIYRVDTVCDAALIVAEPSYAAAGETVVVTWRDKPGFVVSSVAYGLAEAASETYVALENGGSFVMPAGDVAFAVEAAQDERYRYNLYASVVDGQGTESDQGAVTFDGLGDEPTACEGDTVVVELSVAEGYQAASVTAEGLFGTAVSLSRVDGLHYQFVMPADLVQVTLVVEPTGTPAAKQAASLEVTKSAIHVYNSSDEFHTGNLMYQTVTLSGSLMGRDRYLMNYELQRLTSLDFYENEYSFGAGNVYRVTGVSLVEVLRLFVEDRSALTAETPVTFELTDGTSFACTYGDLSKLTYNCYADATGQPTVRALPVLLAFGQDGVPYADACFHVVFGQESDDDNNATRQLVGVTRISVGANQNYSQHSYAPYNNLNTVSGSDVAINVYRGQDLISTVTYTVKDIEALANADAAGIQRGMYSTLIYEDNETTYSGPYTDYYEGYSLYDVLLAAGLPADAAAENPQAKVQFYQKGTWDDAWKTVNVSLGYVAGNGPDGAGDYRHNFTEYGKDESQAGVAVFGMAPTIAYGKNGYPLVYSSGTTGSVYTAYNYRGPMIAMLPQNKVEGGYVENDTVAACFLGQIDVYLPAEDQEKCFEVSAEPLTAASDLHVVTYTGDVSAGQRVELDGVAMECVQGVWCTVMEASDAAALTNGRFAVVEGAAAAFVAGDVNQNGEVNIVDVQAAYDMACGVYVGLSDVPARGWLAADADGNGVVDAVDAFRLQARVTRGEAIS